MGYVGVLSRKHEGCGAIMVRPVDGLGELSAQELDTGGVGMSSCKVERCSSISIHADAGGRIEAALQDSRGA